MPQCCIYLSWTEVNFYLAAALGRAVGGGCVEFQNFGVLESRNLRVRPEAAARLRLSLLQVTRHPTSRRCVFAVNFQSRAWALEPKVGFGFGGVGDRGWWQDLSGFHIVSESDVPTRIAALADHEFRLGREAAAVAVLEAGRCGNS